MRFATGGGASSEEAGWGGGVSGPGADCANAAVAQTSPAPVIRIVLPIDHMVTPQTQARLLSTKTFPTAPRWVPGANLFCPTLVIRAGAKGLLAPLLSLAPQTDAPTATRLLREQTSGAKACATGVWRAYSSQCSKSRARSNSFKAPSSWNSLALFR